MGILATGHVLLWQQSSIHVPREIYRERDQGVSSLRRCLWWLSFRSRDVLLPVWLRWGTWLSGRNISRGPRQFLELRSMFVADRQMLSLKMDDELQYK